MKNLFDLDSVPALPTSGRRPGERSKAPWTTGEDGKIAPSKREKKSVSENEGTAKSALSASEKQPAGTITQTVSTSLRSSSKEGSDETLPMDWKPSSEILREGVLSSMSYADKSMSELSLRMKGLFSERPDTSIRLHEVDRVQTAAGTARVIAELIKAKTEAMKLLTHQEQP